MKNTKLNYKYIDMPHGFVHCPGWGQDMKFEIELYTKTKKDLLKTRTKLVRDVAKLFAKYGIDTETFNCQNDYI